LKEYLVTIKVKHIALDHGSVKFTSHNMEGVVQYAGSYLNIWEKRA
jgi:hypothetical protein